MGFLSFVSINMSILVSLISSDSESLKTIPICTSPPTVMAKKNSFKSVISLWYHPRKNAIESHPKTISKTKKIKQTKPSLISRAVASPHPWTRTASSPHRSGLSPPSGLRSSPWRPHRRSVSSSRPWRRVDKRGGLELQTAGPAMDGAGEQCRGKFWGSTSSFWGQLADWGHTWRCFFFFCISHPSYTKPYKNLVLSQDIRTNYHFQG